MARQRADRLLVERGIFESRAKAQAAIAAGLVIADGRRVARASDELPVGARIEARPAHPYVSRGALKLAAAFDHFRFDPAGRICLDVGASTGGFTELLLERGAALVHAVDVGRDQLHARLRGDARVVSLEGRDIRAVAPQDLRAPPTAVTIDVSFISLKLVLPAVTALIAPSAWLVALIKPQFEAGRAHVKKGIVRDAAVHDAVCKDMADFAAARGWRVEGIIASPLAGGDGNRESLLGARRD